MNIFGRDSQEIEKSPLEEERDEIFEFPFSVLWQDEEQSSLLQYLPAVIQIVLLIWVLIKVN